MPQLESERYLTTMALDSGLADSWLEINEWAKAQSLSLSAFESECIYTFSKTYAVYYSKFNKTETPRPYYEQGKQRDTQSIRAALRG
jgi:hypothetical protein